MSSRNSTSNAECGDNCHSRNVLEMAIKELNLKGDFYNTTRCIHNDLKSRVLHEPKLKPWINSSTKILAKSLDNISKLSSLDSLMPPRSGRTPLSDRSCYSVRTFKTSVAASNNNLVDKEAGIRNTGLSNAMSLYVQESKKFKNLTPFEIKLQKDLEAYQIAKREAFETWLRKKEQERKAKNKKNNKEVIENQITPEEREETFRKWCERKKQIERDEKQRKIMEKQRQEEEKRKALEGKEEKLKEWLKRKSLLQKEQKRKQKEEELRQERMRQMRKRESEEAYKQWLRHAKNKPLPVPLNRGELSMKGSLTKMFVNPEPWKHSSDASSSTSNISD